MDPPDDTSAPTVVQERGPDTLDPPQATPIPAQPRPAVVEAGMLPGDADRGASPPSTFSLPAAGAEATEDHHDSPVREGDLIGAWVVERRLGRGGMGSVFECHNRHAVRMKVAVKLLDPSLVNNRAAKARFVREADILSSLDHPHIVKVTDVDLASTPPFLVMEFVEGSSLEAELARRGPMPVDKVLTLAQQLASALNYLHRKETFHRDIKPANLVIRPDGVLKLVDFGLAVESRGERITGHNTAFGTVPYAPPEWVRPVDIDPASWDLYASGVVFYEMLTGKVAFPFEKSGDIRRIAIAVMAEKQRLPYIDLGPGFPPGLVTLVRDLTRREPEQRLASARELLQRLQALDTAPHLSPSDVAVTLLESNLSDSWRDLALSHPPLPDSDPGIAERVPEPRVPPPAVTPVPDRPAPRLSRAGWLALWGGVVGAGASVWSVVLLIAVVAVVALRWAAPPARTVDVVVFGVPDAATVTITAGGRVASRVEGFTWSFDEVPAGETRIAWVAGRDCGIGETCPGPGCAVWCAQGDEVRRVPPGAEPLNLTIAVVPPSPRRVQLTAPALGEDRWTVTWGTERPIEEHGPVVLRSVQPGAYDVEAFTGTCRREDRGCVSQEGGCPDGCSAWHGQVVVAAAPSDLVAEIPLTVPRVAPAPAAPAPERPAPAAAPDPRPSVVTSVAPSSASTGAAGLVTSGAFARWLEAHPEWLPEAARGLGLADASYLRGWSATAAGPGAMTGANWHAADAYCRTRGGLADLAASPATWDDGGGAPIVEWRQSGGAPAWRRFDGVTSTRHDWASSNSFTGFRCKR